MDVVLPVEEALHLAGAVRPLPSFLLDVRAEGSTVHVQVDLRRLPGAPLAVRLAAATVGHVDVSARFLGYDDGVATFALRSGARGLPVHALVNAFAGTVTTALRGQGLGDLVEVRPADGEPVVTLHVAAAVAQRATGLTVDTLDLRDGAVHAHVTVHPHVRPRETP